MSFSQKLKENTAKKIKKDDLGSSSNSAPPFEHNDYMDNKIAKRFSNDDTDKK